MRFLLSAVPLLLVLAGAARTSAQQGGIPGTPGSGPSIHLGGSNGSRGPSYRTIVGHVTNEDGKPAASAMVYLKNLRTSSTQILLTDNEGSFRFGPLSLTEDFQVWAQDGDRKTPTKPISQFNQVPLVTIPLRFAPKSAEPEKGAAPAASPSSATPH